MAEYLPLYIPGTNTPYVASAPITGGQLVVITGDKTVGPSTTATAAWAGVAAFDAATGERVGVYSGGVQRVTASGAITAGDIVVPGAAGAVVTNATPGAGQKVGVARSTAASTTPVEVLFDR